MAVNELISLQAVVDHKRFFREDAPADQITAVGAGILYRLDIIQPTPYFELGMASVTIEGRQKSRELAPQLGVGADFPIGTYGFLGMGLRYFAILGTDTSNPAYLTLNARLGVRFGSHPGLL